MSFLVHALPVAAGCDAATAVLRFEGNAVLEVMFTVTCASFGCGIRAFEDESQFIFLVS